MFKLANRSGLNYIAQRGQFTAYLDKQGDAWAFTVYSGRNLLTSGNASTYAEAVAFVEGLI